MIIQTHLKLATKTSLSLDVTSITSRSRLDLSHEFKACCDLTLKQDRPVE